jgi:hypothetical protein
MRDVVQGFAAGCRAGAFCGVRHLPSCILNVALRAFVVAAFLAAASSGTAFGWGYGSNAVQNPSEDGASNTGYGPGWVLLSYMPNCPGVGYFSEGLLGLSAHRH